jgi:DNA repair protein RAD16
METGPINEQQPAEQSTASQKKKYYKTNKRRKKRSGELLMWEVWEEGHDKWINENLTEDVDFDHNRGLEAKTAEAPSDLIMPLLRFQKEWLAWALEQEESSTRGGILADEMGMGKTIQAIALVLAKRELHQNLFEFNGPSPFSGSSSDLAGIKATLVVCPVVAVTQWVNEIDRYTTKGSTKVLVYHGANREKSSKLFHDYDFVITTYSIIESEFRKYMMPPKKKCVYCGNSFYEKKLTVHLKYFCGPDANRTAKQSKQAKKKLKTVPSASKQKTESDKDKSCPMELSEVELGLQKEKSLLHSLKWERIILDEVSWHA